MQHYSFRGNPNLKGTSHNIEWTPELIDEFKKCAADPIYFITRHMRIINIDHGLVPFELYDYQEEIVKSIVNHRNTLAVCSRQSGKTTAMTGYLLWYVLFHKHKDVAILANKGKTAMEILSRIQKSYTYLPTWIQQGVETWNKGSFILENGSRIIADTTASDALRGYAFSVIVIDEAAHIDNWDDFYTSVYPVISSGQQSKLVLISTPFGLNHFYQFYSLAKQGKNDFSIIEVPWQRVPNRDQTWRDKTLAAMNYNVEKFEQEFSNEWLGSSGTLISGACLKMMQSDIEVPIQGGNGLCIYRAPEPEHSYVITVDVSRGKGLDFSAFQLIDVTRFPYEQVATYRSNQVTIQDYSDFINVMGRHYHNAMVLVEINDIGEQVSSCLFDLEYEHVLCTEAAGKGKRLTTWVKPGGDLGIRTTKTVKNIGCSMLKLLLEQNGLKLHDANTIGELSTFSKKNQSYEAEEGCHDDLVMGLVLFGWMTTQDLFKGFTDFNAVQSLRDMTADQIENQMILFGWVNPGEVLKSDDDVIYAVPGNDDWLIRSPDKGPKDEPPHLPLRW